MQQEALIGHIRSGDIDKVRQHLNQPKFDVTELDNRGRSLLFPAVRASKNKINLINMLCKKGCFVDQADDTGRTVLMDAAFMGDLAILHRLLELGASVTKRDHEDWTALMKAACADQPKCITVLLKRHSNSNYINQRNKERKSALLLAVEAGAEASVAALLNFKPRVDMVCHGHYSPLMDAASRGRVGIVKRLLAAGAQVDFKVIDQGITALMMAAISGHVNIVEILVGHGANVDAINKVRKSPLIFASEKGHVDVIRFLLGKKARATVDLADTYGNTALAHAVARQHAEVAAILLCHGADPHRTNKTGDSAVALAINKGDVAMVRVMLPYLTDYLPKIMSEHSVPLTLATGYDPYDLVKLLLQAGAWVDDPHRESGSCTPLLLAAYKGHFCMMQLLLDYGADLMVFDRADTATLDINVIDADHQWTMERVIATCLVMRMHNHQMLSPSVEIDVQNPATNEFFYQYVLTVLSWMRLCRGQGTTQSVTATRLMPWKTWLHMSSFLAPKGHPFAKIKAQEEQTAASLLELGSADGSGGGGVARP